MNDFAQMLTGAGGRPSATPAGTETLAVNGFRALLFALRADCTCDACVALRGIADSMLQQAPLPPSQAKPPAQLEV